MLIDTPEGAVYAPDPNPMVVLARGGRQAAFLARLCDDVVWDIFVAYEREEKVRPTKVGAAMLDVVRAELHRRHAPAEPEIVCSRCLCAIDDHDDFDLRCPDDERFRAAA